MKNKPFYVDVDLCERLGIIGKTRVYLNGVMQKQACAAKSGKDGFVEVLDERKIKLGYVQRNDEIPLKRIRGNVRIKINKHNEV